MYIKLSLILLHIFFLGDSNPVNIIERVQLCSFRFKRLLGWDSMIASFDKDRWQKIPEYFNFCMDMHNEIELFWTTNIINVMFTI